MEPLEEQFDRVLELGSTVRIEAINLLRDAFRYEVKFFHLRHPKLTQLESSLRTLYDNFIDYEHRTNGFILTLAEIKAPYQRTMMTTKHINTLEFQRSGTRMLIEEIGRLLGGHRSLAINHTAIQLAFVAIIISIALGIISIYLAIINNTIIVVPPK